MVKRIRNNSEIIGWSSGIIALKLTHCLAVLQVNLWRNTALNTASKNRAKDRYTLIEQSLTIKYCCDCSIRVSRSSRMFILASDYIAAGYYPLSNLMYYSGGCRIATSSFCCNGQPLRRALLQCSHLLQFKKNSFL